MAKGKGSRDSSTSKGERRYSGTHRSTRTKLEHVVNAINSWKKGSPPSKKVQSIFNVPAGFPYSKWAERGVRVRTGETE